MGRTLLSLAFHRTGKPRKWVFKALFKKDGTARPLLQRIVYKKSGRVRPRFAYWMSAARKQKETGGSQTGFPPADNICPEEAALRALRPLEEATRNWRGKRSPTHILGEEALAKHLSTESGALQDLVISVSHDDYTSNPGGVQLCIQREQAHAAKRGMRYLQIYPYHAIPRLAHLQEEPDTIVALNLDGAAIGVTRMSTLIAWVEQASAAIGYIAVVVHHLRGHSPEQVAELVQATGSKRCVFWLHDSFSICPSVTLQRNNLVFCRAPTVESNACTLCVYGRERITHSLRMRRFFESLDIAVASPSAVIAEFWKEKAGLPYTSLSILPHITLEIVPRKQLLDLARRTVTIGFLGAPAQHKGWPIFVSLMHEFAEDSRYRFAVLSTERPQAGENSWQPVHVTAKKPNAMSDAVAAEEIDIVLHWPTGLESFSFTTFEAIIGGAHIVTHTGSGNVAATVREVGHGVILENEEDLRAFFRNDGATALAEHRRNICRAVEIVAHQSDLSFTLIRNG